MNCRRFSRSEGFQTLNVAYHFGLERLLCAVILLTKPCISFMSITTTTASTTTATTTTTTVCVCVCVCVCVYVLIIYFYINK